MRGNLRRGVWALAALLALALSGCGAAASSSAQVKSSATATATATPLPALAWTPVKLPAGVTSIGQYLAISPVDGHDAWMCKSTSANTYVIWKTTDAGQSWLQSGHFSYNPPMVGAECSLIADQTGTSALMATITWGCGECGTLASAALYSANGATQWTPLPKNLYDVDFSTVRGGAIAITNNALGNPQGSEQNLVFSADGFRTWRSLSPHGVPTLFYQLAISPDDSTLIGAAYNSTLWRSTDLGAHWTQLPSPGGQTSLITWLPQRGAFLMCGGDMSANDYLECSTDYGEQWHRVNILSYTQPCPVPGKCGQGVATTTQQCGPIGAEPDGSLVAECETNQTTPLPAAGPSSTIVYILPLGATTWQPVGLTHCAIRLIPTSGPVWCANATPDQLLGYSTGQLPG